MAGSKVALVVGAGEAIAENYWRLHQQSRSAWTHELDQRPWMEPW